MDIAIIILAAGSSSRLGQPKQLLQRGNQSMIQYVHEECLKSKLGPVYVVTGAYHDAISAELNDAEIIHYPRWENGMGSSISYALKTLKIDNLKGVIIALSDQVYLTSEILTELAQEANQSNSKIVNCKYQSEMGPPTYFDKSLFQELEQLTGDDGAKSIVKKYKTSRSSIRFVLGEVDIDTTEDLQILDNL